MIVFLWRPDDYRRSQRRKYYVEEFRKKYSNLGIGYFDLAEVDALEKLAEFIRSASLFEASKLAVLENLYEVDERKIKEVFMGIAPQKDAIGDERSQTIVLCSENRKPDGEMKFLLEKPVWAEPFPLLEGSAWENFAATEAKRLGLAPAPDALRFLADVFLGNSWGLVTELEKLSALKRGVVERKDLDKLELEINPEYWPLFSGLRDSDWRRRLITLERLFGLREPTNKIFNILASQWRERTPQLAAYDLAVKTGKLDYDEAILDLVIG